METSVWSWMETSVWSWKLTALESVFMHLIFDFRLTSTLCVCHSRGIESTGQSDSRAISNNCNAYSSERVYDKPDALGRSCGILMSRPIEMQRVKNSSLTGDRT